MPLLVPINPSAIAFSLTGDFDIDASGQIQPGQSIHGFFSRLRDLQHPLVGADFVLIPGILVDVRGSQHRETAVPRRAVVWARG